MIELRERLAEGRGEPRRARRIEARADERSTRRSPRWIAGDSRTRPGAGRHRYFQRFLDEVDALNTRSDEHARA
jgi:hypothetical protein